MTAFSVPEGMPPWPLPSPSPAGRAPEGLRVATRKKHEPRKDTALRLNPTSVSSWLRSFGQRPELWEPQAPHRKLGPGGSSHQLAGILWELNEITDTEAFWRADQ